MKKTSLFLALLLIFTLLAGCGGSSNDMAMTEAAAMEEPMAAPMEDAIAEEGFAAGSLSADGVVAGEISVDLSAKIIYTASADIETTEFEKSIETVHALLETYQGFIESSSVTGSNLQDSYYGYTSLRSAWYTLRFPRENYAAVTGALSSIGNVTYLTNDATNITTQYTDTESRLAAYETEEERLLEILSQAETVEDMISVESRLSEIRYEKEYLTSQLTNWDNQVSYSTISLNIQEVKILTPTPVEELTYWQEVLQALKGTISFMYSAAKGLLKFFIAAIPLLLPVALVVVIVLVIHRRSKKKAAQKKEKSPKADETSET